METLGFVSLTPIEKGWSGDRKYKAVDREGKTFLLRISPLERRVQRENLYAVMSRLPADLSISRPLAQGICSEGIYTLWSWVEGADAEEQITAMPESQQYHLGLEAGALLRRIHVLPAPPESEPWHQRFGRKIDRKLQQYADCPVHYEDGGQIVDFIRQNRYRIEGRPQCFQHGDYHIGNMMLEGGKLVVIDFDRYDFGDPWEEFNRIVWCAQAAPAFAAGQLDGYFDGIPPEDFFALLALYIAVNTLSSLPWAMPFGQEQIDVFLAQEREIMDWYDGFRSTFPKWYTAFHK